MLRVAGDKGIRVVMLNTNGIRIAKDDRFLDGLRTYGPLYTSSSMDSLHRPTRSFAAKTFS